MSDMTQGWPWYPNDAAAGHSAVAAEVEHTDRVAAERDAERARSAALAEDVVRLREALEATRAWVVTCGVFSHDNEIVQVIDAALAPPSPVCDPGPRTADNGD